MMRTLPCCTCTNRPHLQVTSRLQLGFHVHLGISQHPCMISVISPSYGVGMMWSWMCWNRDDETLLFVLVPDPEASWIILCDHGKVLRHLLWTFFRLCIVSGLKPKLWVPPWSPPTLGCPLSGINSIDAAH